MQHGARARSVTSDLTLVIGNKNYSSWSLRPWLALRNAGIPFTERLLLLFRNLSTILRHRRFLFTDSFLLLWEWRVG